MLVFVSLQASSTKKPYSNRVHNTHIKKSGDNWMFRKYWNSKFPLYCDLWFRLLPMSNSSELKFRTLLEDFSTSLDIVWSCSNGSRVEIVQFSSIPVKKRKLLIFKDKNAISAALQSFVWRCKIKTFWLYNHWACPPRESSSVICFYEWNFPVVFWSCGIERKKHFWIDF